MLPETSPRGRVVFDGVTKEYRLGYRRAFFAAALPLGNGLGGGAHLRALDDVSFTIEPGESFALLGHNGAGKSTALKCLSGLTLPSSGRLTVGGRVSALIELGVGFHPDISGLENLRFSTALAGLRGAAATAAVDAAVAFAEIDEFLDTPVKRYSSGMVARIGFGIATALPGDVLVVDEVLAVGDAAFQRKCMRKLAELRSEDGRTLLFVSHNEWVVKETCERAALLDHGRVVMVGPVQEALRRYSQLQTDAGLRAGAAAPPESTAAVRLGDVELLGIPDRVLDPFGPLKLRCVVDVSAEAVSPVLGVCLLEEFGRILWAVYSDELGAALPKGRSVVDVEVDRVAGMPGDYRLQAFTFDRTVPLVEEVRTLRVSAGSNGLPSTRTGVEHGLVAVRGQMSVGESLP